MLFVFCFFLLCVCPLLFVNHPSSIEDEHPSYADEIVVVTDEVIEDTTPESGKYLFKPKNNDKLARSIKIRTQTPSKQNLP